MKICEVFFMYVLIACEESQTVCKAFRERGHDAFSCDIQECSGGHPEWHIQQDVSPLLNGDCTFFTLDGRRHFLFGQWDLIIAHPPCTFLSNAGACRLFKKAGVLDLNRFSKGLLAKKFFMDFYNADCDKICIENPVPLTIYELPAYTQIIQPYEYGHHFSKKTCLWLKGLPSLKPTDIVSDHITSFVYAFRDPKLRSKTFTGIANAMADQWG